MSNICERCGGIKNASYEVEFLPGKRVLVQHQSITMKICLCPPERFKHDGKLEGGDTYEVYYDGSLICIQGTYNLKDYEVILEARQALSLLTWLRQEETTLEELAKEQP